MHRYSTRFRAALVVAVTSLSLLSAIAPPTLAANQVSAQHRAELEAIASARGISVEEASARDQYRQRAQPLYDAVAADPNNFGGIYSTDEGGRWRIVVRYVGDAPPSGVRSLVAEDIPVDWVAAHSSMARLNEVFGELRIVLAPAITAKRVSQITPDEASNTVLVGFPREDPDLQKTLTEIYGDILSFEIVPVFEPVACTSRYDCTPWRGGIAAQRVQGDNTRGSPCTTSLWAKHRLNAVWYVVTAGHCNNISNSFWHDSVLIGTADFNTIVNLWSPSSDALRVPHQKNTSNMNTIYYAAAIPAYVISATEAQGNQHVGDSVCKSGLGATTFGTKCGQITALWGQWQANGKTISGRVTDVDVSGGDSGAPFYYANALMGLGAAGNTQSSIYSLATWAEDELSVTFCHTGSCL